MKIAPVVKRVALTLYLPIALTLGILAQLTEDRAWSAVCYSLIILNLVLAALFYERRREWLFCFLALVFTAVSDFFLVVCIPERATLGVAFFIPVQAFYFLRLYFEEEGKVRKIHLFVRITLCSLAVFVPIIILGDSADVLSVLSVVYFVNILLNAAFSTLTFKSAPLLSLGLILFFLCDLFVGLGNLDMYLSIEKNSLLYGLTHTGLNMPWIFYAPSQILLTLSMTKTKKTL